MESYIEEITEILKYLQEGELREYYKRELRRLKTLIKKGRYEDDKDDE
jgi:hypothetical protein